MALNGKRKGLKVPADMEPGTPAEIRAAAVVLRDRLQVVVEAEKLAVDAARDLERLAQIHPGGVPRFYAAVASEASGIYGELSDPDSELSNAFQLRSANDLIDLIDLASLEPVAA